jgi:hypothetical protein
VDESFGVSYSHRGVFYWRSSPRSHSLKLRFYGLAMGLVGGLFHALRAARLPIPSALREL